MTIKKIYLDTSFISHLDAPDKMRDTLILWDYFNAGKYEIIISKITLDEISQ